MIMKEIKSIVITGPTGAIGTALCKLYSSHDIKIYAIVRPNSKRTEHLNEITGIELIKCDISELEKLALMIPSADAFFHLAWAKTIGQGRNDMPAQIDNIHYTMDAVHAAKALGCEVFIGAGSQAEYGRVAHALTPTTPCFPENGYGMAKLCAGQMSRTECQQFGIRHVWPRILSVYGPHDGPSSMINKVIHMLLRREKPSLTEGTQIWDYLYADDAANALYHLALFGKNGGIYPLGSGKSRPLREYIELLRDTIDPSLPLGFGELAYGPKQIMHLEADMSALYKDTGYVPNTDFKTGIIKTIEHTKNT